MVYGYELTSAPGTVDVLSSVSNRLATAWIWSFSLVCQCSRKGNDLTAPTLGPRCYPYAQGNAPRPERQYDPRGESMENLRFTVTDGQFHLEGFPDAVKVLP